MQRKIPWAPLLVVYVRTFSSQYLDSSSILMIAFFSILEPSYYLFLLSSILGHLLDTFLDTVDAPNQLPNESRRCVPNGSDLNFKSDPQMGANECKNNVGTGLAYLPQGGATFFVSAHASFLISWVPDQIKSKMSPETDS